MLRTTILILILAMSLADQAGAATAELWEGNVPPRTRDLTMSADGRLTVFGVMVGGFRYATLVVDDGHGRQVPAFASDPRWRTFEPHLAPAWGTCGDCRPHS